MKQLAWLAVLAAVTLAACSGGDEPNTVPIDGGEAREQAAPQTSTLYEGWLAYRGVDYTLHYPNDWTMNTQSAIGAEFELYAPEVGGDDFRENINLVLQDLGDTVITIEEYSPIVLRQIQQGIANVEVLASSLSNNGKLPYYEIVYTGGNPANLMKWRQHFYIANGKAYVLTYGATAKTFDVHNTASTAIMASFEA